MESRQVARRNLFSAKFTRYPGGQVPKDLKPRRERRNLARAYAAKDWRIESAHRADSRELATKGTA